MKHMYVYIYKEPGHRQYLSQAPAEPDHDGRHVYVHLEAAILSLLAASQVARFHQSIYV